MRVTSLLHQKPTVLDLFAGCGGFTAGAHAAGLTTRLAVDIDPILSGSFERNFPGTTVVHNDVTRLTKPKLKTLLPDGVDIVIGGPPCQGFSEMGSQAADDPRRKLVGQFFRVVEAISPAAFVFENVRGLAFPNNIGVLQSGQRKLSNRWKVFPPVILDASDFGAATRRKRVFVFGFNLDRVVAPDLASLIEPIPTRVTVRDAIADLRGIERGIAEQGTDRLRYPVGLEVSSYAKSMRSSSGSTSGNSRTVHQPTTLERFAKVPPGGIDKIGRYPRLAWGGLCPTLRAGTGSDKGSYQAVRPLHPEEDRVITPREAARLQGFHDDFEFHPTVWHSCRMIGNSVSPIIARVLLERLVRLTGLANHSDDLAA